MPKSKPVYPGHINLQSMQVIFSDEQRDRLITICNKSGFIECIQDIAECYLERAYLLSDECKSFTTEAENLATLKDLNKSIEEILLKIRRMPGHVKALLYKEADSIRTAEESLKRLMIESSCVLNKTPKPKTGRKTNKAELAAARSLKQIFQDYGISYEAYLNSKDGHVPKAITA